MDIKTDAVSDEGDDDLLRLTGYGGPDGGETDVAAVLANNGHTAKLTPEYVPADSAPTVRMASLRLFRPSCYNKSLKFHRFLVVACQVLFGSPRSISTGATVLTGDRNISSMG